MNASELVLSRLRPSPEELLALETELATCRAQADHLEWLLAHLRARPEVPAPVPGLREMPPAPRSPAPRTGNGHAPRKKGPPAGVPVAGPTKANVIRDVALPLFQPGRQLRGMEVLKACPAGMTSKDVENALKRDSRFARVGRGLWALAAPTSVPGQAEGNVLRGAGGLPPLLNVPAPVAGTT
jgi:hypothetical protein